MSRHVVALTALAVLAVVAPAQAAPPHFLVYGVGEGEALDYTNFPQDGSRPPIEPMPVPIGDPSFEVDLYHHNWSPSLVTSTSPCDPDPAQNGADVAGDEVCGWHLLFAATNGLEIVNFSAATSGDVKSLLTDDAAGDTLNVTGGTPLTPSTAAVAIGTVTLSASAAGQQLEARPGGAESVAFVAASLQPTVAPISIVASSESTCGDTVVQSHEECDFGNETAGDGDSCYRNCEDESEIELSGAAAANGNVQIDIETVSLVIPTSAGETAEHVAANVTDVINANATLISLGVSSEQVGSPADRVASDGEFTSATSNTPGLTIELPEPSRWLMLAAGVGFLATAGRRRFAR
jgi:cysteine-rich repeat protein